MTITATHKIDSGMGGVFHVRIVATKTGPKRGDIHTVEVVSSDDWNGYRMNCRPDELKDLGQQRTGPEAYLTARGYTIR